MIKNNIRRTAFISGVFIAVFALICSMSINCSFAEDGQEDASDLSERQVIVKTDDENLVNDENVVANVGDYYALEYDTKEEAEKARESFEEESDIDSVQTPRVISVCAGDAAISTTPSLNGRAPFLSYGPGLIGSEYYAKRLITSAGGTSDNLKEVVVAIVDSGIDQDNKYLSSRIKKFSDKKNRNFIGGTKSANPDDDHFSSHGTHVAGIVADTATRNVKVSAYKVADSDGNGTDVSIANGIMAAVKDNADVINVSMAGLGDSGNNYHSTILDEAINEAYRRNIPVVVAAGNNGPSISGKYRNSKLYIPGNSKYAITVSAVNEKGKFCDSFSKYGSNIDFAAPGDDILSTVAVKPYTGEDSGTSMAAPFVAGSIAMLKTDNTLSVDAVNRTLRNNATDDADIEGKDDYYGYGTINLNKITIANQTLAPSYSVAKGQQYYESSGSSFPYCKKISVALESKDANAKIYYTTDGSVPTTKSKLYEEPIELSETTCITTYAKAANKAGSVIKRKTYYAKNIVKPVENLRVSKRTTTTLKFRWDKQDNASQYKIYRYIDGKRKLVLTTEDNTYTAKNLEPGKAYTVMVKAYAEKNSVKYYSDAASIKTAPALKKAGIRKITTGRGNACIYMKSVSNASGYQIKYKRSGIDYRYLTSGTSKKTYNKTNLRKNTKYYFKARAYRVCDGKKVYGDWSSSKSITVW